MATTHELRLDARRRTQGTRLLSTTLANDKNYITRHNMIRHDMTRYDITRQYRGRETTNQPNTSLVNASSRPHELFEPLAELDLGVQDTGHLSADSKLGHDAAVPPAR